jgi:hypothetical protein
MEPELSRELGDLFAHNCFYVNPMKQNELILKFDKYNNETDLPEDLKKELDIARSRRKNSKNIMSNYKENSLLMISGLIDEILKERGEFNDINTNE